MYPTGWRHRYGNEFDALLAEVEPGWRVLLNVLRGAITMRMAGGAGIMALGVAGAVIATAISFLAAPTRYVSTAVLEGSDDSLALMEQEMLSRGSLASVIRQPSLDLYRTERERMDMTSVVEQMRRDLTVRQEGSLLRLSFGYRDPEKAQAVTSQFTQKLLDSSIVQRRNEAKLRDAFRADLIQRYGPLAFPSFTNAAPPVRPTLSIVSAAAPAIREWGSDTWRFALLGFALGSLAMVTVRSPGQAMRFALYPAAGCLVAFAASFLIHPVYTSTATMRITPAKIPELSGVAGASAADRVRQAREELFTDAQLKHLFLWPAFRFTPADIATVLERIQVTALSQGTFQVTSSDSNRFRAKQMADTVVRFFFTQNAERMHAIAKASGNGLLQSIDEHMAGENLEVLDPASLPVVATRPGLLLLLAIGTTTGLLLSIVARIFPKTSWLISSREDGQTPSMPTNLSEPFAMIGRPFLIPQNIKFTAN